MFDILHRVGIEVPSRDVYEAITDQSRLAAWWTNDVRGRAEVGSAQEFHFGDRGFFQMKILELKPNERVVWEVAKGPEEWLGTKVIWELVSADAGTTIRFKHQGWREPVEFMGHCSTKWGTFLMSLKSLLEAGRGAPFPNDQRISVDGD